MRPVQALGLACMGYIVVLCVMGWGFYGTGAGDAVKGLKTIQTGLWLGVFVTMSLALWMVFDGDASGA